MKSRTAAIATPFAILLAHEYVFQLYIEKHPFVQDPASYSMLGDPKYRSWLMVRMDGAIVRG
jgi:hypothetical protein